ncbi:hypothetical protein PIB30_098408 [Stylosanthes scabra]|uniref:Uncharacterized protein n=1 Tax=Stylosanthes scabra TaxID=79078 RepID=A0ABU6SWU4_9FABA|nr:hypothetical protein [Stylosanthes scabra]
MAHASRRVKPRRSEARVFVDFATFVAQRRQHPLPTSPRHLRREALWPSSAVVVRVKVHSTLFLSRYVLVVEVVKRDGKLYLLSLGKVFYHVLAVYEGFCNLKQVVLKLKICRGSSVKKILVREAIAYSATHVVLGTCHGHHKIRSSTSLAELGINKNAIYPFN